MRRQHLKRRPRRTLYKMSCRQQLLQPSLSRTWLQMWTIRYVELCLPGLTLLHVL